MAEHSLHCKFNSPELKVCLSVIVCLSVAAFSGRPAAVVERSLRV